MQEPDKHTRTQLQAACNQRNFCSLLGWLDSERNFMLIIKFISIGLLSKESADELTVFNRNRHSFAHFLTMKMRSRHGKR